MRACAAAIEKPLPLKTYLRTAFPALPPEILRKALSNRDVRRQGKRLGPEEIIHPGDELLLYIDDQYLDGEAAVEVVYADKQILLVNKRPGMSVVEDKRGAASLQDLARHSYPTAVACHRLDYYTGGLVVFALTDPARLQLEKAFLERTISKFYRCLVFGKPQPGAGRFSAHLVKDSRAARVNVYDWPRPGSLPIQTAYRTLDSCQEVSLLEVELITGRTHQIRAHLAHLGYPIAGDDLYGQRELNKHYRVAHPQLWATRLEFSFDPGPWRYLNGRVFSVKPRFSMADFVL